MTNVYDNPMINTIRNNQNQWFGVIFGMYSDNTKIPLLKDGTKVIVASIGKNDFVGKENCVAVYSSSKSEFTFYYPTNGALCVVNENLYIFKSYQWEQLKTSSNGDTDSVFLSSDIVVSGVNIGSYSNGMTIAKDTELTTILKNLLQSVVPPNYSQPTLNLSPSSQNLEVGSSVNPNIISTFVKNDAGYLTNYKLDRNYKGAVNTVLNGNSITSFTQPLTQIEDGQTLSFMATVNYAEGIIKNDNLGNPSPNGHILSGNLSKTITYNGQRKMFYGTSLNKSVLTTSTEIRTLSNNLLNPVNGTTFTINIPIGCQNITIAYPSVLRDLTSVKYVELNMDVADTFSLNSTVLVEGLNGLLPTGYKVYTYVPLIPFGSTATYQVTI